MQVGTRRMCASYLRSSVLGARALTSRPPRRLKASSAASVLTSDINEVKEQLSPLPFSAMPGPKRWPLVGSVPAMFSNRSFDFKRLPKLWRAYFREYGPIFRIQLPGLGDVVYLSQAKDIEQLMRSSQDNPVRPFFFSLKKVRDEIEFFKKGQTGIITEQGEEWWRVRRLVQPHSMKPKMVHQYLPQMDQVALEFVDRMSKMRDENKEVPGNFTEELFKWSLESVCLVILNRHMGCFRGDPDGLKIIREAQNIFEALDKLEYGFQFWRFVRTPSLQKMKDANIELLRLAIETVNRAQQTLAAKVEAEEGELNLVEALINTPALAFEDVVTYILDFFMAAVDTTSMTLMFTLYNLALHPEQQANLQRELDEVLGKDATAPITLQQLSRLTYTKACVREALRLFPIAGVVGRRVNNDLVLENYKVPKGTIVFANMFEAGQSEAVFPRPGEFSPERWLRSSRSEAINPYASLPFSIGPRMCIGSRIAQQEVYTLLARIFQRFDVSYKYEAWDPIFKLILFPDKPQKFTVTERTNFSV